MRDMKDSSILATAILKNIDIFVTGGKDFLDLDVDMLWLVIMTEFLTLLRFLYELCQ